WGIPARRSSGQTMVSAIKVGADMMLLCLDEITAIQEVKRAVERGKITEERITQSVRKILEKKNEAGLFQDRKIDIDLLSSRINSPEHRHIANEISRKSLTLLKNEGDILPISPHTHPKVLVLSITDSDNEEEGAALVKTMREYHPGVRHQVFHRETNAREREKILQNARWADLIVIGAHLYINCSGNSQFNASQQQLLSQLPSQTPKALLTFGNPYTVQYLPSANVLLLTWDDSDHQLKNTPPALFAPSAIGGRLPINIPGAYDMSDGLSLPKSTIRFDEAGSVGFWPDSLREIDKIVHEAIFDSTFPGGVITVLKDGV